MDRAHRGNREIARNGPLRVPQDRLEDNSSGGGRGLLPEGDDPGSAATLSLVLSAGVPAETFSRRATAWLPEETLEHLVSTLGSV